MDVQGVSRALALVLVEDRLANRRFLAEGALRAKISDGNPVFQRAAGRHDFDVQALDRRFRQRPAVTRGHALQYLRLAFGPVFGAAFGVADLLRESGAFAEQIDDPVVERIDALTDVFKLVCHLRVSDVAKRNALSRW